MRKNSGPQEYEESNLQNSLSPSQQAQQEQQVQEQQTARSAVTITQKQPDTEEKRNYSERGEWVKFVYVGQKKKYLTQRSLNLIPLQNWIRYKLICLVQELFFGNNIFCLREWNRFDQFIILIIMLNSIFLGLVDYSGNNPNAIGNKLMQYGEPIFTSIFIAEAVIKIVAHGFLLDKHCYLRDGWNWLDFVVVLTALLGFLPGQKNVSMLRTFRLFRPLRSLTVLPNMRMLVNTLLASMIQTFNIFGLVTFFLFIFAVVGISLFNGVTHYRCRLTPEPVDGDWLADPLDTRLCGGYHQCAIACGSLFDYNSTVLYKVTDFRRDSKIPELNWDLTHFDRLSTAILIIFQCTSLEGWAKIMYMIQDGFGQLQSAIFFILCVMIGGYFLFNLVVAVMLNNYVKMQNTEEKILKLYKQAFNNKNIDLETKKAEMILELKKNNFGQVMIPKQCQGLRGLGRCIYEHLMSCQVEIPNTRYYDYYLPQICYKITQANWFYTLSILSILTNAILLCLMRYPWPQSRQEVYLKITSVVFLVIFTVEIMLQMVALGFKTFIRKSVMVFDLTAIALGWVELGLYLNGVSWTVLRILKMFLVIKSIESWKSMKLLIESIQHSISAIFNFSILLALFMYIYSLLGMQFFASEIKLDADGNVDIENGASPRLNFDTIVFAFITVFSVLVGEGWDEVLQNAVRCKGWSASIYFISLVVLGNFILLNLFLAILLGNFEECSILMNEKQFIALYEEKMKGNKGKQNNQVQPKNETSIIDTDRLRKGALDFMKENNEVSVSRLDGVSSKPDDKSKRASPIQAQTAVLDPNRASPKSKFQQNKERVIEPFARSEDSSYDSSFTQYDGTKENQSNTLQDGAGIKHSESDFSQKLSGESFEERKKSPRNIDIEDTDLKHHQHANKSLLLPTQGNKNALKIVGSSVHDVQNMSNMDFSYTKTSQMQAGNQLRRSGTTVRKGSYQDDQPSHTGSGIKLHRKPTMKSRSMFKTMPLYRQHGVFFAIVNYMRRSSLFLLHKRSWLRLQILRLVVPLDLEKIMLTTQENADNQNIFSNGDPFKDMVGDTLDDESEFDEDEDESAIDNENMTNQNQTLERDGQKSLRTTMHQNYTQQHMMDTKRPLRETINTLGSSSRRIASDARCPQNPPRLISKKTTRKKKKSRCGRLLSCSLTPYNTFENTILVLIILSSIVLVLDTPLNDPNSTYQKVVHKIDSIFTLLFLLEAIIKIMAFGFVSSSLRGQKPYMSSGWNVLDFFVVIVSCLDYFLSDVTKFGNIRLRSKSLKSFKALRALRALRPLRVISKNEGLKLVVDSLFASLPAILNVMVVGIILLLFFVILGMVLFKGVFYHCTFPFFDPLTEENLERIVTDKWDCLNQGGLWVNQKSNFDNIFQSLISLIQLMITEGWLKILYSGIDSAEIDEQPKENHFLLTVLFFIPYIIIGNMFILNLFVGVVIENFNRQKDKLCGYIMMTKEQKIWMEMQRYIMKRGLRVQRKEPENRLRKFLYTLVRSNIFDLIIIGCIVLNTIFMALKHFNMPAHYQQALDGLNYFFVLVFNLERLAKLIAFGRDYFSDSSWNTFDFILVILADFGIIFKYVYQSRIEVATAATVIRCFRVISLIRVIKKSSPNIKVLIDTLFYILPAIANIGTLIFLVVFIYAVLGMNLFGYVMYQDYVSDQSNFRKFGHACMLLLRCATGEDWNALMWEFANKDGYKGQECIYGQSYESMMALGGPEVGIRGCGSSLAFPFFISYIISVYIMIMNLFVAVVVEGYNSSSKENNRVITADHFNQLIRLWAHYDKNISGFISPRDLAFLIFELDQPLGKRNEYLALKQKVEDVKNHSNFNDHQKYLINKDKNMILSYHTAQRVLNQYAFPLYENQKAHFKDVCLILTLEALKRKTSMDLDSVMNQQFQLKVEREWVSKFSQLKRVKQLYNMHTGMHLAGAFILKMLKNVREKRRLRQLKQTKQGKQPSLRNLHKTLPVTRTLQDEQLETRKEPHPMSRNNQQKRISEMSAIKSLSSNNQSNNFDTGKKEKERDTTRSTWWQERSTRMEQWLVNQQIRDSRKKQRNKNKLNVVVPKESVISFNMQKNQEDEHEYENSKIDFYDQEDQKTGKQTAQFGGQQSQNNKSYEVLGKVSSPLSKFYGPSALNKNDSD